MNNIEKNQEALAKMLVDNYYFAVTKEGTIGTCHDIGCEKCLFTPRICNKERKEWLYSEYKEPILDDIEREYLSAVIRPFRSQVEWFKKMVKYDVECIAFKTTGDIYNCTVLPEFKTGTMYKGMENGMEYTLEELNL